MIQDGLRPSPSADDAAAAAASAAPASRRLRIFELALVVGVGYLISAIYSLHDWWTGAEQPPEDVLSSALRIVEATLSIALLAYVLHRQGRSLRSIGLTARLSDLPWGLAVALCSWLLSTAVYLVLAASSHPELPALPMDYGLLGWLMIVPAAAAEELIVRAFLMTEVAALTGSMGIAAIVSVGFQTLYHLYQGPAAALMSAGAFFVAAVFYASTRRITPVILAHALTNFWYLST